MSNTGHFDVIDDQTIEIRKFLWENKAVEANEVAEAAEVNEATVVSKAWKIINEDFRVILVLEFNILRPKIFLFDVWKKKIFDRIIKTHVEFSVGGFWGQPMLLFWKLMDETQMP